MLGALRMVGAHRRVVRAVSARAPTTAVWRPLHTCRALQAKVHNKHIDETYNTKETPFEFTPESLLAIEDVLSKYPSNYPQSACIPVLWIAQKQHGGWLPLAAMDKTAEVCKMPPILVYEVATFYTMFNRKKIGKYNIQMCTTTPCMVLGAYDVLDTIKTTLDCAVGGDSADGMFHLMEVECLGACANAPMMQISHAGGDEYFEDLTPENVVPVLKAYQADTPPPPGPQHGGPEFPPEGGVRAGPQPGGPLGHAGQRRGCEGPLGKTCLIGEPTGPQCRELQ